MVSLLLKSSVPKIRDQCLLRIQQTQRHKSFLCDCLRTHHIIPDVIDRPPKELAKVHYSEPVELGNELTPTQVKDAPHVTWPCDKWTYYTLVMLDPDVPSRYNPREREWHHWLVGNIPGDNVSKGQTVFNYTRPDPEIGTGLHRYIFLVYEQSEKLRFYENLYRNIRSRRSVRRMGWRYNQLKPHAANFFVGQFSTIPLLDN